MGIVISFFEMLLFCVFVVFVAFLIVWGFTRILGEQIDANVYKWGKVLVGLICFIAFLVWIGGVLGMGVSFPHYFPRS